MITYEAFILRILQSISRMGQANYEVNIFFKIKNVTSKKSLYYLNKHILCSLDLSMQSFDS